MAIGEKLWEGKGKGNPGFIKSIDMSGVTSVYTYSADLKGMGRAAGLDFMLHVTAKSMMPPHGVGAAKDMGTLMNMKGDMAIMKGFDLSKMSGPKPH